MGRRNVTEPLIPVKAPYMPRMLTFSAAHRYRAVMSAGGSPVTPTAGGATARFGAAAVAILSIGAVGSCSFLLDFDGSTEPPDAGVPDALPADVCERFEPNAALGEAATLTPGTYELGLCDGKESDFFAFSTAEGEGFSVYVSFDPVEDEHELELYLYDADTEDELNAQVATDGEVSLDHGAGSQDELPAGDYAVEVRMSEDVTSPLTEATYTLALEIDDGTDTGD